MFTVLCAAHHVQISYDDSQPAMSPQWDKVDANQILTYRSLLHQELSCIAMSSNICSTHSKCLLVYHCVDIDNYYDAIISAIKMASHKAISCIKVTSQDRIIAGWNDLV